MKTLIIVGSPNKNGQSMQLVKRFSNGIKGEVEIINVFDYDVIHPCLNCGRCTKLEGCSQDDYFSEVIHKINASDCIVLASPMWFGNISGPLMSFMSRINTLRMNYKVQRDVHKWDKIGILLMTTGAKWYGMAKSVEATVEFLFQDMDAFMLDCVYANKSDVLDTSVNQQALMKCDYASKLSNMWYVDKLAGEYIQYGYSSSNLIAYEKNTVVKETE